MNEQESIFVLFLMCPHILNLCTWIYTYSSPMSYSNYCIPPGGYKRSLRRRACGIWPYILCALVDDGEKRERNTDILFLRRVHKVPSAECRLEAHESQTHTRNKSFFKKLVMSGFHISIVQASTIERPERNWKKKKKGKTKGEKKKSKQVLYLDHFSDNLLDIICTYIHGGKYVPELLYGHCVVHVPVVQTMVSKWPKILSVNNFGC